MPEPTSMSERERVDRFEAAYNRIDHALTDLTERRGGTGGFNRRHTFAAKVRIAANRLRRLAKHVDFLQEIGDLRNALVHNRTDVDVYIAVPSQQTVEELERIEQRIFAPEKVIPRFARRVVTLRPDQSLAEAWNYVRQDGYSRYPVYGPQGFVGLLTSNGFARWIANQVKDGKLEVDARQVKVTDVLDADHRRDSAAFVAADASLDDVAGLFADNRQMEAVIITEHGRSHEKPLGLLCAADVAGLE